MTRHASYANTTARHISYMRTKIAPKQHKREYITRLDSKDKKQSKRFDYQDIITYINLNKIYAQDVHTKKKFP